MKLDEFTEQIHLARYCYIREVLASDSTGTPARLSFSLFFSVSPAKFKELSRLGHCCFVPNPFKCIHPLPRLFSALMGDDKQIFK
jgi:hypothetical protein